MPQNPPPQPHAAKQPVYNCTGDRVALGPGSRDEVIDLIYRGDNSFQQAVLSGDELRPRSREAVEADYDRWQREPRPDAVDFVIYILATGEAIGGVGLRHIHQPTATAEFGVSIQRSEHWGKGYGTEAALLTLDYGFTVLGLHNILLETYAYNERALASYRTVGFREIGRRREAQRLGEKRYDTVYMDILRSEFHSPLPPIIPAP